MRTVSKRLIDLANTVIPLGFVGENLHTQIRLDSKKVFDDYPAALPSLTVKPPIGAPYPAVVERDGDIVIWSVNDSDLVYDGVGEIQLSFIVDEVVVKSFIGKTRIERSILPTGEAPTPIENWINEANEVLDSIPATIDAEFAAITAEAETLEEGSPASAEFDSETKVLSFGIPKGDPGEDGISPSASVSKSGKKATITITDKDGTTTAEISDGKDGQDGDDGFSPSASVTKSGDTATITITDKNGTTTAQITDGQDGEPGATPALSIGTVETLEPSEDATVTITGTTDAPVLNFGIPKGDPGEVTEAELQTKADLIEDTASGAIATFPDGANNLPMALTVGIEPVQDLHGQSNPYPQGGGKNKFDKSVLSDINKYTVSVSGYLYTDKIQLKPNTQYIIKAKNSGNVGAGIYYVLYFVNGSDPDAISISSATIIYPVYNGDLSISQYQTFTTAETGVIRFGVANSTALSAIMTTDWQLEEGSTATAWSPYSNICPISGRTGCNVNRTGINIWDEEWEVGALNITDGNPTSLNTTIRSKNFIPCSPSTSYFRKTPKNIIPLFYDVTKRYIGFSGWGTNAFTTPYNCYYIKFYLDSYGTTYNHDISINYPATDTEYHPGTQNETYSISFGEAGTVYGGTLTVNKDGTGELVVDRAKIYAKDVDFTVNPIALNDGTGYYLYKTNVFPNVVNINKISNVYRESTLTDQWENRTFGEFQRGTTLLVLTVPLEANTLVKAKQWLVDNDPYFVYPLATPVTYTLTDLEVIATLKGINNVWADTGDTTADYPADTKLYIAKSMTATQQLIELIVTANREETMKATKAYTTGNLLIVNGTLYKATTSIANGATLTVGTNVTATTVANELALLA